MTAPRVNYGVRKCRIELVSKPRGRLGVAISRERSCAFPRLAQGLLPKHAFLDWVLTMVSCAKS